MQRLTKITLKIVIKQKGEKENKKLMGKKKTENYKNGRKYVQLWITTLNVYGLNAPIKRQGVAEQTQNRPMYLLPKKRLISDVKTHTGWKLRHKKALQMEIRNKS